MNIAKRVNKYIYEMYVIKYSLENVNIASFMSRVSYVNTSTHYYISLTFLVDRLGPKYIFI